MGVAIKSTSRTCRKSWPLEKENLELQGPQGRASGGKQLPIDYLDEIYSRQSAVTPATRTEASAPASWCRYNRALTRELVLLKTATRALKLRPHAYYDDAPDFHRRVAPGLYASGFPTCREYAASPPRPQTCFFQGGTGLGKTVSFRLHCAGSSRRRLSVCHDTTSLLWTLLNPGSSPRPQDSRKLRR